MKMLTDSGISEPIPANGKLSEWSMVLVLKADEGKTSKGSNPLLSVVSYETIKI